MRQSSRRQLIGLSLTCSTLVTAAIWGTIAAPAASSAPAIAATMVATRMAGLHPGDRLSLDGVSLLVPHRGHGAWGAAIRPDGSRVLGVRTGGDGSVTVYRQGVVTSGGAGGQAGHAGPSSTLSACSDGAYLLTGTKWNKTYTWRFNMGSVPSNIPDADGLSAIRAAMGDLTGAQNDCGLSDKVSATTQYMGTTTKTADINTDSSCQNSDNTSVVDFGNLPATDLGYVCWWTMGGSTTSSDMRLNSSDYAWVVNLSGCVGKYSVEDVATHELGHSLGLKDLSEQLHPALTMSLIMLPCQNGETTLGLGDIKGLEALY